MKDGYSVIGKISKKNYGFWGTKEDAVEKQEEIREETYLIPDKVSFTVWDSISDKVIKKFSEAEAKELFIEEYWEDTWNGDDDYFDDKEQLWEEDSELREEWVKKWEYDHLI